MTSPKNIWQGGKPGGSTGYIPKSKAYKVRFWKDPTLDKLFKVKDDDEEALEEALAYQREISKQNGWTKNMYKHVDDHIVVELDKGKLTLIDPEDLHLFTDDNVVWHAQKCDYRYYAVHSARPQQNIPARRLHNLICPQWEEVDHINRDGLDNRKCNLRNGKNSVNQHNQGKRKDNKSGKTGVSWHEGKQSWVVQWQEDGKRKQKYFRVGKIRTIEEAKLLAIGFRRQKDIDLHIENGYNSDQEIRHYKQKKVSPYTPEKAGDNLPKGVQYRSSSDAYLAIWTENGKRKTKTYTVSVYGDKAREMAIAKREEMMEKLSPTK